MATDELPKSAYEMLMVNAVVADQERHELIIAFKPKPGDPPVVITLPAGAVGDLVAKVASAHREIALQSDGAAGAFVPIRLTGARPFQTEEGTPILLLQFEGSVELAVQLPKGHALALARVVEELYVPRGSAPPKRH